MKKNLCLKHVEGPYHDCAYVDARNELIPSAIEFADKNAPPQYPITLKAQHIWNRIFHDYMNWLWKQRRCS